MDSTNQDKSLVGGFNIVKKQIDHKKGFGKGTIDLNNVSSVIIDGEKAYIDVGALHAKSKVEMRIRFSSDKEAVPNGRQCWIIWVAIDKNPAGAYYAGATACEMLIDTEARKGWKILAEHVNKMDYAMKRRVMLDDLGSKEKAQLKQVLVDNNAEWYERSEAIKTALEG